MKWKLVARMQVRRTATTRRYNHVQPDTWIDIKLGPSRTIRCECAARGEARDLPRGVGRDGYDAIGTCNHIEALYLGNVTQDKRVAQDDEHLVAYEGRIGGPRRLIHLTQLGEQMFRWRWAQLALERST